MEKPSTLIFDLDGTLSDPAVGVVRCMNYALTSFDYTPLPDAEITQYIGPPLEQTIARLTGSDDVKHVDAVAAAYRERYGEIGYKENTVYPGITEMLDDLQEAGIPLAVCTSKLQINAERVIDSFSLGNYFQFICGSSAKSSKAEQLETLVSQNTIDRKAIMVGDRAIDLTAAHSNGISSVGVLWGYGSMGELKAEQPEEIVESPVALRDYILSL